ncbi:MAG TPA: extracellular solute-binding protein [Symbiobacteriaceae bacterium]|nr:extracellular solute-binding protein [Symbiobacteriaceae bacterium]
MKRVLCAILVLLLLSACSSKVPTRKVTVQADVPGAGSSGPSIVRVLTLPGDPTLDVLISAYYGKYQNARVDKVTVTAGSSVVESFRQKLVDGAADVVPLYGGMNPWTAQLVQSSAVVALDPYIQKAKFNLSPLGSVAEQLRVDGHLYELPYLAPAPVIVYNLDMFTAAGLPFPKEGWTWDQFREAARKLTRGDGDGKVWGLSSVIVDALAQHWFYERSENWRTDEKALREGLQFFATLLFTDKALSPSVQLGPSAVYRDDFWQGKAAMSLEYGGFASAGSFRNSKVKYGVAPFPVHAGGKSMGIVLPYTMAVASNGQNLDAAWQFVSFACGPEGALALAKAGYLPVYNTADVRRAYADKQPAPPPGHEALFAVNWQVPPRAGDPLYPLEVRAEALINQVMSGAKDWENAVAEYLREAESLKPAKK